MASSRENGAVLWSGSAVAGAEVIAAALLLRQGALEDGFGGFGAGVPGGALLAGGADAAPAADQRPFAEEVGGELERVEALAVALRVDLEEGDRHGGASIWKTAQIV